MARKAASLILLLGACGGSPPVVEWGKECAGEMDCVNRLEIVRKIMASEDERSIPVLIDCLAAVTRLGKTPDRVYRTKAILPNETAPPELWGLYILTGQDFDLEIDKWSLWYESHRGRLLWDGGTRRFIAR